MVYPRFVVSTPATESATAPVEPLPKGYDAPTETLPLLTICDRCGAVKMLTPAEEQRIFTLGFMWCTCSIYSANPVPVETKADIYYNRLWKGGQS